MFKVKQICSVDKCNIEVYALGYCFLHYQRFKRNGDVNSNLPIRTKKRLCKIKGCKQFHIAKGYCSRHYQHINKDKSKKYNLILKLKVFEHYCDGFIQCSCCGEKNLIFLTLDHIKPLKRKNYQKQYTTGPNLFRKLIKLNYPKGYQVHCYNCNCAKRISKQCPHQLYKSKK